MLTRNVDRAAELLGHGQGAAALRVLLEAWRELPAVPLARAVERVAADLARHREPLGEGEHELWLQVEARRDPLDLDRLLEALTRGSATQVARRARRLAHWPDDPRRDLAVAHLLQTAPPIGQETWAELLRSARSMRDPRVLPVLQEVLHRLDPPVDEWLRKEVELLLRQIEPALRASEQIALPPTAARRLEQLATGQDTGPPVMSRLLERVLQQPDDDDARLVYADALSERGDPRGELIVLQVQAARGGLSPEQRRREQVLLERHAGRWLGPLSGVVNHSGLRFERGFVSRCTVAVGSRELEALRGHPAWATVTHLEGPLSVGLDPALRSLRVLELHEEEDLTPLLALDRPLGLERLRCYVRPEQIAPLAGVLADFARLPALSDLQLAAPAPPIEDYQPLLDGPLGRRLERVRLSADLARLGPCLAAVSRWGVSVGRLELTCRDDGNQPWGHDAILTREADGRWHLVLELDTPPNTRGWVERIVGQVCASLTDVEPADLTALVLRPRHPAVEPERLAALRELRVRFGDLLELPPGL